GPRIVYGVWSPPALEMGLIERIAERVPVSVFLPSSGLDADDAHAAFRARLHALGAIEETLRDDDDASAFASMRDALFRDSDAEPIETDGVALVSASDTVREVWDAARTCLQWASQGMRFHEMAVVYRN